MLFSKSGDKISTKTNQFQEEFEIGISNGEDIYFRVLFKPVAPYQKNRTQ